MIVPDVNLLIYAYNSASPYHQAAKKWWESCLSGQEPVGLTHAVIFAFVRIVTTTRAFTTPLTLVEAQEAIDQWLARTVARTLHPASDHIPRVMGLLAATGSAGGNLVTNAQIAALAMEHSATVHTADRDFMRFPHLKYHYPLEEKSA